MPTVNNIRRPWMPAPAKKAEVQRETAAQKEERYARTRFYRTKRWGHIRAAKLAETPYCEECYKLNKLELATVVDHIIPIRQGGSETDMNNLASNCDKCHNRKRQTERYSMQEYRKRNGNGR